MRSLAITMIGASVCASLAHADSLSTERVQELNNVIELSLKCEVASGLLKGSLALERERLRQIITSKSTELGIAMLTGQVADPDPAYGRRCLVHFNLTPRPGMDNGDALFLIGFEIGKVRSCYNELFVREMLEAFPNGPLIGGNSIQEIDDRKRSQEFAHARFDKLGCLELINSN